MSRAYYVQRQDHIRYLGQQATKHGKIMSLTLLGRVIAPSLLNVRRTIAPLGFPASTNNSPYNLLCTCVGNETYLSASY